MSVLADVVLLTSDTRSDIELSSGSRLAWEGGQDPPGCYVYEARIPREPWISAGLKAFPAADPVPQASTTVAVLPRSEPLVLFARELGIGAFGSIESCRNFNASRAHEAMARAVQDAFAPYFSSVSDVESLGLRVGEPEAATTTWDYGLKAQPGLHVDNWDRLPPARRTEARNRLCVNLGSERRYLLFLPVSLRRMLETLGPAASQLPHIDLIQQFFDRYPELPVCRLPILPGEAYVAPTDNIVHDGSTLGSSSTDVCFSLLGRFGLRAGKA